MYIIPKQFKKDYCLTKIPRCTVEIGYDITSVFSASSVIVVFILTLEAKIISNHIIFFKGDKGSEQTTINFKERVHAVIHYFNI